MPKFTKEDLYKLLGAIVGALSIYYATLSAVDKKAAVLEEREQNHYLELKGSITDVKQTQREILGELRRRP